jgi:phosphatidylserine/phosphatidylglycerophosphate/cardiolipin synthase-like enzyme
MKKVYFITGILPAIFIYFFPNNPALADQVTAQGCVKLLDSEGPNSSVAGRDWNYYRHGFTGYHLKDEANEDVIKYYKTIFQMKKFQIPSLEKTKFCAEELQSLTEETKPVSRSIVIQSSQHCLKILERACTDAAVQFESLQAREEPLSLGKSALENNLDDLWKDEDNYLAKMSALEPSFEIMSRIVSGLEDPHQLKAQLATLFEGIKVIKAAVTELLSAVASTRSLGDIEASKSLQEFEKYFPDLKDTYQKYNQEYWKYDEIKKGYSEAKNNFLYEFSDKLSDTLLSPVRRVSEYVMSLETIADKFKKIENQDEVKTIVADALRSAKEFDRFVNSADTKVAEEEAKAEEVQKESDEQFEAQIKDLPPAQLRKDVESRLGEKNLLEYYNAEYKTKGTSKAAQSVREIILMQYRSSDDENAYCKNTFSYLQKERGFFTRSKLLTYRIMGARLSGIRFNARAEVAISQQLISVCMNKSAYAKKYFETLSKIANAEPEKLESIRTIVQALDDESIQDKPLELTKGRIWGKAKVNLKGRNWIVNSPQYRDAHRLDFSNKHSNNFIEAWSNPISEAESFVDITTLSVPEENLMQALKLKLKKLDEKNKAITIRIMFGINAPYFPLYLNVDVDKVVKEVAEVLKDDSKLVVSVGTYGNASKTSSWNHSKIVAVDGQLIFTGGHNLYDAYFDENHPIHDLSVTIPGKLAEVGHNFANTLWKYATTTRFAGSDWYTFKTENGKKIINQDIPKEYISATKVGEPKEGEADSEEWELISRETGAGPQTVIALGRLGVAGSYEKGSGKGNVSDFAIVKMIEEAKISLFISQQAALQLVFSTKFNQKIVEGIAHALMRGVDVFLLSSSTVAEVVGEGIASYTGRHNREQSWGFLYDAALALGYNSDDIAEAFFKHLSVLPTANGKNEVPNHAKLVIADGNVSYVGSHNLYDDSHAEFGVILGRFASEELVSDYFSPLWLASSQLGVAQQADSELSDYKIGDYVYVLRDKQEGDSQSWTLAEIIANTEDSIWANLDFLREIGKDAETRVKKIESPDQIIKAPGNGNSGRTEEVDVHQHNIKMVD